MTRKRKAAATRSPNRVTPSAIVGSYFHTFGADGTTNFQGHVLEALAVGVYFVELFSWMDGRPIRRSIVRVEAMEAWQFYPDADEMGLAYDARRASDEAVRALARNANGAPAHGVQS